MNPQSLMYMPAHLVAERDPDHEASPHAERGERAVVQWVALAAVGAAVVVGLLVFLVF